MSTTCPYCGHPVTGEVIADCGGCGNPVPMLRAHSKRERVLQRSEIIKRVLVGTHKFRSTKS